MAHLIPSSFTRYELTPEEQLRGSVVTPEQRFVLQNHLCSLAEEKIALKFDPITPSSFLQREAELQGQIGFISFLLAASDEAEQTIRQIKENQQ